LLPAKHHAKKVLKALGGDEDIEANNLLLNVISLVKFSIYSIDENRPKYLFFTVKNDH
jgi:hypothetical protein